MDKHHLFNITEISRGDNSPLTLEFYGGDITSAYSDVLLTSAFRSSYAPVKGTVFGRIHEKFGINLTQATISDDSQLLPYIHRLPAPSTSAFSQLWVLEIPGTSPGQNSDINFTKAFHQLKKLGRFFDEFLINSISLPLLGAGLQKLEVRESAINIMESVRHWSHTSSTLKEVRVFAYDLVSASVINREIDRFFGSPFDENKTSTGLLYALADDLKSQTDKFSGEIRKYLELISQIATSPTPSVKSIAIEGRKLAEVCSRIIYKNWFPDRQNFSQMTLNQVVSCLQTRLLQEQAWILSYLEAVFKVVAKLPVARISRELAKVQANHG
jgi:hypothetical protein